MCWARARSTEQKEKRVQAIVDATAKLYKTYSFEDITFVLIAKEAGFTRSNLYKYFRNKEEIFLELLSRDINRWTQETLRSFSKYTQITASGFCDQWVEVFIKQKRLIKLFTILFTFLEKNSSLESIISFKRRVVEDIEALCKMITELFPKIDLTGADRFIHLQLALSVGLYPMSNLSEKQLQAIEIGKIDYSPPEFITNFRQAVLSILLGLIDPKV